MCMSAVRRASNPNLTFSTQAKRFVLWWPNALWTQLGHTVLFPPEEVEGKPESVQDQILFWKAVDIIRAHPLEWLKARAKQYPLLFADTGQYLHGLSKRGVEVVFLTGNALFLMLSLIGLYILGDHF